MSFWLITIFLFVLASLFVLVPLWLRSRTASFATDTQRKNLNLALFHERSNELESELATGALEQEQFDGLMLELQQSLLDDVSNADTRQSDSGKRGNQLLANTLPILLALLIPVLAYGLYEKWGYAADVELMDLFQRTADNTDDIEETQSLIVSLGEAVREHEAAGNEDRPWAWYFLAENFAALGMFAEAEIAYRRSAEGMQDTPEKALVLGRVAMAQYILAEFQFTEEIVEIVEQARAINPGEISILQLLALDAEARKDYRAAIEYWRRLIQSNPNSEQVQLLRSNVAAAQQILLGEGEDVDAGPVVEINLMLADGIELDADLRVFVAARNAEREGMPPLAATDLTVGMLPTTIRLDNSFQVGPFNLSSAESIYLSALVSFSGTATPSRGDYRVVSQTFAHNGQHAVIDLVISEQVL